MSEATTFQLECGCLLVMDGGESDPCLIHQHEEITPLEAMVMVFRTRLGDDTPEQALAFIKQKRDEINGGRPVEKLPGATP